MNQTIKSYLEICSHQFFSASCLTPLGNRYTILFILNIHFLGNQSEREKHYSLAGYMLMCIFTEPESGKVNIYC